MGANYIHGFLKVFGLDDSMFPQAIDQVLYEGFFSTFDLSLRALLNLTVSAAIAVTASYMLVSLKFTDVLRFFPWLKGKLAAKFSSSGVTQGKLDMLPAGNIFFKIFLAVFFVFVVLVSVGGVAVLSQKRGEFYANNYIAKIKAGKETILELSIKGNPTVIEASTIFCGSLYCAFWVNGETVIFPNEAIEKIAVERP
jgi:hypothetical protein